MKKIVFIALLIIAIQILPGCRWGYNPQTSAYGWISSTVYEKTCDGTGGLPPTFSSEEGFLTWLVSQEEFDDENKRLFAIDKIRFKLKKIPKGYHLSYICVDWDYVSYCFQKGEEKVFISFRYDTIPYTEIEEGNESKTFEESLFFYDRMIYKGNRTYYVTDPRSLYNEGLVGHIVWDIDNYKCAIYTQGIESYDDSIFEYCDYEKAPLK